MKKGTVYLLPEDVLHIPALGFDGLVGYSPIAMAKNSIGVGLACEEYGAKFFANGAAPSGVLEHPGVVKDPNRIRDSWEAGTLSMVAVKTLEKLQFWKRVCTILRFPSLQMRHSSLKRESSR